MRTIGRSVSFHPVSATSASSSKQQPHPRKDSGREYAENTRYLVDRVAEALAHAPIIPDQVASVSGMLAR